MVEVLGMQEQFSVRSASIAEDAYKKVGKGREQDAEALRCVPRKLLPALLYLLYPYSRRHILRFYPR